MALAGQTSQRRAQGKGCGTGFRRTETSRAHVTMVGAAADVAGAEPPKWGTGERCILGIDEAGRGPCLGPMVYSAAWIAESDAENLNSLGANDSKQLKEEQRDELRLIIDGAKFVGTATTVLHAAELSAAMLRPDKYNLNAISHDAALGLVRKALDMGVNVKEVYADTVGDPGKYAEKFRVAFPDLEKVVVETKADANYRIVGAASIVAKTTRDAEVKMWEFLEETRSDSVRFVKEYGSGYPSDPRTKKWLAEHVDKLFGYPSFVRFSWSTSRVILEKEAVAVTWCVLAGSIGSSCA
jgi:ribonuclease H2 subunit A